MFLTDDQLIRPIYSFNSEFLAHCCTKGKSEKILLLYYSYRLSKIIYDELHELQTEFEKKYNLFFDSRKRILGDENADMVLSHIDDPEKIYAIFEAKQYYTFDYDKENINSDILHDLKKLNLVRYNLYFQELKRYFVLFLAHYAKDELDDNLVKYGSSHNSRVLINKNHQNLLKISKKKFKEYLQSLNSDKLTLRILGSHEIQMGIFEGLSVILYTIIVEVL